jgi:hypothetical protein
VSNTDEMQRSLESLASLAEVRFQTGVFGAYIFATPYSLPNSICSIDLRAVGIVKIGAVANNA